MPRRLLGGVIEETHPTGPSAHSTGTQVDEGRTAHPAELTRYLYERHGERLFTFCFGRLRNREEAQDAVQTTFIYVLRSLQRGIEPEFELAYDYFGEAALMDLHDLEHNTRDGVHIASLAGAWLAAVAGFGGLRDHDGFLSFAPRLPTRLERLAFGLRFRGRLLKVEATKTEVTYTLKGGEPLELSHHGDRIAVSTDRPLTRPIPPPAPERPAPSPPPGREPMFRGREREDAS